ncbi:MULTISPECIES: DHA2 family efflux MFS transporter permease subunit [Geobacillus]|jgi:EmrB/QacA subfamily drug resistance transporter|uniref:DHA2 family efflux MFS transporter permease subunit n=1 Tax=Geobacillus thermodenitrificans TaxID=33940 RepID=A0ABY9QK72_GEOTD|nr:MULTISPECIES: DHA2 family efflux MFS transporter permease subunit [Geobacillus]ARP42592.1 putative MFS-type transporter YcnB [Geobacillus thermodenitrificans]ATO36097.1 MFS transporter [Geobacillus thermodenitrificans]KQB93391.1 putative MFS-type transporter YhcA [Geobacillus sp. PA-3]MEC5186490.1 EmrB/QacA subfamily drug resistance transporter [Geobacillus thermodenitrificans]MED0661633.1 MFS transporter [Geobacillus thermodenitrificans]
MSTFMISYIIFAVFVLAVLNIMLRRRKSAPAAVETADGARADVRPATSSGQSQGGLGDIGSRGKVVVTVMLGAFVAILNQTLINVALPHMMQDFNVETATIQWLVTGYMLVNGVLIPISPFLIAKFPTKTLFVSSMSFFAIGAFVCSIAPTFAVMLAGRLTQAVGAGIIMQLMMVIMLSIFPPERRGVAMGTVGIAMMFAPAVGPTLSGWLVEHYTWRLLFYVVLPIAIVDLVLASLWLKKTPRKGNPVLDMKGAIYSTIGFGGVLYGFSEAGSNGWGQTEVVVSLVVGSLFLVLFTWRSLRSEHPVLNFRVFRYPVFTLSTVIGSVINMAMFAAMVLLPVYLQNLRGFTPLDAGLLLLPGAIVMAIMSPISGWVFDRIGARALAIVGLIITAVTTWEFSKLTMDTPYSHLIWLYIFRMFGMSMLGMPIMTEGLNALPRHLYSHGTAMANTLRQVAASLGTAFLVTVMSNRTKFHVEQYRNEMTETNPFFMDVVSQLKQVIPSDEAVSELLYGLVQQRATVEGINDAFFVATGLTVLALLMAFFLKGKKHKSPSA